MRTAIFLFILLILFGLPIFLTVVNIVGLIFSFKNKSMKQKFINITDFLTMFCGIAFTIILIAIINFKDYTEAIKIPTDTLNFHSPIASWHSPTIITLFVVGIIGYIVLRIKKTTLPPLQLIIMFSFMIIGIFIGSLCLIQLSNNIFNLLVFYLSLFPLNFIICSITLMKNILRDYVLDISDDQREYKNKLLYFSYSLLIKSKNWIGIAIALMLPVLIVLMLILILFGQQPDAIIKAFTETSDWVLSKKISPPPVEVDAHYLCTVSLRGHKKLVKPLRYGIRRNTKIVVNRQLLVANAFEQLIQEKTPKTHKIIRYIYDKYGYPLSRHINTTWSADLVYIIMKPLEWLFLVVLYAFDNKPETRIAKQYLP